MAFIERISALLPLARRCREAGGRALLVGGAVRDHVMRGRGLLWIPPGMSEEGFDLDVEVHGIPHGQLRRLLRSLGPVNTVGQVFSVFKLDLDVSLPRRDSKVGQGHRGIQALGDPFLGVERAARRRDLTINAIAYDPLTGAYEDPFGGVEDIERHLLRAVDVRSFGEDPLRALRVAQFAARFRFQVHPQLLQLCASMPIAELPAERLHGELRKLLLLSPEPSWGLAVGRRARLWSRLHPALDLLCWEEVGEAVDRAALLRDARFQGHKARAEALMLVAMLHPLSRKSLLELLDRIAIHTQDRFPLRRSVMALRGRAATLEVPADDGELRMLSLRARHDGGLGLWLSAAEVVQQEPGFALAARRSALLGVDEHPPEALVKGRHLKAAGMAPGPRMGVLLERAYHRQLREGVEELDQLLSLVERWRGEEE